MNPLPFVIGFIVMSLASLALYFTGSKAVEIRHHTYFHATVPFIAATAYLAMALGVGNVTTGDGVTTLTARYADWAVTTPILLSGLILLGVHEHGRAAGFIVSSVVLDALMIGTGLLSALSETPGAKLVWFCWSCAAFLGVLYNIWAPVRTISKNEGGPMAGAYAKNLTFLSIVWFIYPIVFGIGPEGIGAVTAAATAWAILVLDIVAKVIYGFTSASNIKKAYDASATPADLRRP